MLEARLRCARGAGCGQGREAGLAPPPAPADGPRRGRAAARSRGTAPRRRHPPRAGGARGRRRRRGERRQPRRGRGQRRADRGAVARLRPSRFGIGRRLQPCPAADRVSLTARTAADAFRQGPNLLRACAFDYSRSTDANRDCADPPRPDRQPLPGLGRGRDGAAPGPLAARCGGRGPVRVEGRLIAGGRRRGHRRRGLRRDAGPRYQAPRSESSRRRGRTRAAGSGRACRAVPSRELRVAYWGDRDHVTERYIRIRSRVRPRLRLHPTGTLHNGDSIRVRGRAPGPGRGRPAGRAQGPRRRALARAPRRPHRRPRPLGRLLSLPRHGRRRRYRFRAFVPRQTGYPYGPAAPRSGTPAWSARLANPWSPPARASSGCRRAARRSRRRDRARGRSRAGARRAAPAPRAPSSARGGSRRPAPGCRTG